MSANNGSALRSLFLSPDVRQQHDSSSASSHSSSTPSAIDPAQLQWLYLSPPTHICSLEELHAALLERIHLLYSLTKLSATPVQHSDDTRDSSTPHLLNPEELAALRGFHDIRSRHAHASCGQLLAAEWPAERDAASHFLVLLACCRHRALRQWMARAQTTLTMHWVTSRAPPGQLHALLSVFLPRVSLKAAEQVWRHLHGQSYQAVSTRVPFEMGLQFVALRNHDVILRHGKLHVPVHKLIYVLEWALQRHYKHQLALMDRAHAQIMLGTTPNLSSMHVLKVPPT